MMYEEFEDGDRGIQKSCVEEGQALMKSLKMVTGVFKSRVSKDRR